MDKLVINAPGLEGFQKHRDLPGFFRSKDFSDPNIQTILEKNLPLFQGLIFNTFVDLEAPNYKKYPKSAKKSTP